MPIITKSGSPVKGLPTTFTLNKSDLAAVTSVAADAYFSQMTNWHKVVLVYRSSLGNQYEIVTFDASLASPTASFQVSLKARDIFQIDKIKIKDFDGGIFEVPRFALTVADFDVDMTPLVPWINSASSRVMSLDGSDMTIGNPSSATPVPFFSNYAINAANINFVDVNLVNFNNASITVIIDSVEVYSAAWNSYNYTISHASVAGQTKTISLKLSLTGYASYTTPAAQYIFAS